MDQIKGILKRLGFYLRDWRWRLAGKQFDRPVLPEGIGSIVFVCKGNICRSAYAHHFAGQSMGEYPVDGLRFFSAGLEARPGTAPPRLAVQVAGDLGVDIAGHHSSLLTGTMVEQADLLIAMEPSQVLAIQKQYPHRRRDCHLLAVFEDGWDRRYGGWQKYHIPDPYGREQDAFRDTFERVQRCVEGLMRMVREERKG